MSTPSIEDVLAAMIEARAEEVYPRDVFIPPTDEQLAEVNALLKRERGHQLDGIAAECYRRAYTSIAAQIRRGDLPLTDAIHLAEQADEAARAVELVLSEWDAEPSLPPAAYNLIDDIRAALAGGASGAAEGADQ